MRRVTWNGFPIKTNCWLIRLRHLCGVFGYFKTDMCKPESAQRHGSRTQSADFSNACSKRRDCCDVLVIHCTSMWYRSQWFIRLSTVCKHFESRRTIYSYFDFGLKNSSFRLPYQRPSSSVDCARELFKGSNASASLVDCTRKTIFWLGGADFLWLTS